MNGNEAAADLNFKWKVDEKWADYEAYEKDSLQTLLEQIKYWPGKVNERLSWVQSP